MVISIIACISQNRGLGKDNHLLYHIPEDMNRFKTLTTGHTILMGRKTYESLPHGALPNRRNIVVSKMLTDIPGCEVYPSIKAALQQCPDKEIFIIGGASLYEATLPLANRIYLTEVEEISEEADTFFPVIEPKEWNIVIQKELFHDTKDHQRKIKVRFLKGERK